VEIRRNFNLGSVLNMIVAGCGHDKRARNSV
jgi:hypothetical protein